MSALSVELERAEQPVGSGSGHPSTVGVRVLTALLVLVLALLGLALGRGIGIVGTALGPLPLLLVPLLAGGLLLGLRRPVLAVAAVPLLVLVGLRPVAGGARVVHLLVLFAVGCALVGARRPRLRARPPAALVWSLVLVLVALASTAVSEGVATALRADLTLLLGIALAWVCVSQCREGRDLAVLLRCFAVGTLVVGVPALAQVGALQGYYGGTIVEGRLTASFAEPNEFGSYSVTAFWMCCALVAASRTRLDRLLGGAGALVSVTAMLFSLSRGSWLGLVVGAAGLVLLHPPAWRRVVGLAALATVVLALLVVASPFSQTDVITQRLSTVVNGAPNPDDRRDLIRAEAVRLISTAPLLGHGPGSFVVEASRADSVLASYRRQHAHNILLQTGVELGVVGVVVLLALTASVARSALRSTAALRRARRLRDAVVLALLGSACVSLAAHGLIDVTFQNPLIMVLDWLVLGVVLSALRLAALPGTTGTPGTPAAVPRPETAAHPVVLAA